MALTTTSEPSAVDRHAVVDGFVFRSPTSSRARERRRMTAARYNRRRRLVERCWRRQVGVQRTRSNEAVATQVDQSRLGVREGRHLEDRRSRVPYNNVPRIRPRVAGRVRGDTLRRVSGGQIEVEPLQHFAYLVAADVTWRGPWARLNYLMAGTFRGTVAQRYC